MDTSITITIADIATRFDLAAGPLSEALQDRYESFVTDDQPLSTFRVTTYNAEDVTDVTPAKRRAIRVTSTMRSTSTRRR